MSEIANNDSDLLFEMANLNPKKIGLPFVVWISPRGNASHDVRLKVSSGPKAIPSEMISVATRPEVRVIEGAMKPSDLDLLRKWVDLDRDVLVGYWDGDIEYTEDAIQGLQAI
jgi:hypothetical protein